MNPLSTAGEASCKINTNIEVVKTWISLRKQMKSAVKTKGLFKVQNIRHKTERKAKVNIFLQIIS